MLTLPKRHLYLPALDRSPQPILIRTAVDPTAVAPGVRAAIRQHQQRIALYGETPLTALAEEQTSASRFTRSPVTTHSPRKQVWLLSSCCQ